MKRQRQSQVIDARNAPSRSSEAFDQTAACAFLHDGYLKRRGTAPVEITGVIQWDDDQQIILPTKKGNAVWDGTKWVL